ncbi:MULTISPECIES: dipeptidase [unclassified Spirosoma]|uniref:dipeptidase n=1 Tax=unclassified Spirosoma TaxID=2621999 RepID=UPI0009668397|nr:MULTISPECIES: dipeptidase [unclassified Spirosoma]MBN8826788.1 dipeptidase [Spirosoma sp.]OJW73637.1 MAG: membrane dipeptidase [Spirosoma sp. 48-14]
MLPIALPALLALNFMTPHPSGGDDPVAKKVHKIHQRVLTLDTHADAPIMMKKDGFDVGQTHDTKRDQSQIDFPRMKQGGMDAMFFAVYTSQGPRTPEGHADAKRDALNQFDLIHQALKKYPNLAELATSPADAYRIQKAGKRAVFIGMENGYPVGDDLSMLQKYYDLGARYITLTHFANNLIGDSSTDPDGPMYGGLSEFGKKVVAEMNRLGILIDVSHVADSTFYDALALSKAPMIASHSNCRAICDFPRNMTDDMIKALAAKGGVVQVNFVSDYLKKPSDEHRAAKTKIRMSRVGKVSTPEMEARIQAMSDSVSKVYASERASLSDIADHIDHIVKLVGIDHVGIGSDFDGGGGVNGLEDVSQIENLTAELVRRNYSEADIAKIWGGNLLRVLGQAKVTQ